MKKKAELPPLTVEHIHNWSFLLPYVSDPDGDIFKKYKEGAKTNAPFKVFQIHADPVQSQEEESDFMPKRRKRGPYRRYTCDEKEEAVRCIQDGEEVNAVAKRFNIPRRNLLRWCKEGCERKQSSPLVGDEAVEGKVLAKIKQGELTDEKQVRQTAAELSKVEGFKASRSWYINFCDKNKVKLSQPVNGAASSCQIQSTDSLVK